MERRRIARRSRANKVLLAARALGMARKCCVKNCEIDDQEVNFKGLPLHKFPKDLSLRNKWLENCGFDHNYKPTPGQFVCHRHFRKTDYESVKGAGHRYILRKGTVPTIFQNYDSHPDPLTLSTVGNITYKDDDLDDIKTSNQMDSPLYFTEEDTRESDNCTVNNVMDTVIGDIFQTTKTLNENDKCQEDLASIQKINSTDMISEKTEESSATVVTSIQSTVPTNNHHHEDTVIAKTGNNQLKTIKSEKMMKKPEKTKVINQTGMKFTAGAKLEAKDFNEKWYAARVVETDWVDREVLIHFDKWSSRFDEWIPMDSSRLRDLQMQPSEQAWVQPIQETKMREFTEGERILATWADGRKYPAKVNEVLGNDKYDVLFDDGYAKIVRSSKMTKVAGTSSKLLQTPTGTDSYIGSKQERRDKKRKHTVMELFQHKKRSKTDGEKLTKKEEHSATVDDQYHTEHELNGTAVEGLDDSGSEVLHGFDHSKSRVKTYPKKKALKLDVDYDDDVGPEWVDGEPQGIEAFVVDGNDGSRRSIIVPDKKLPAGWQKHFIQRRTGCSAGKWDVLFLHKVTGKKFRSRNDIRVFFEGQGQTDFDPDMFDFCIHRRKRSASSKVKTDGLADMPKKIKTLFPKTKTTTSTALDNVTTPSPLAYPTLPIMPSSTPTDDSAVFIGGLRVEMEDSAYKCPKEGCCKTFRKENLLQMHIKHYHPEFSKYLGSTPNVADLAYARTIGESMVDSTPKKSMHFVDRFGKFDKRKLAQEKTSPFVHSPGHLSVASPVPVASPDVPLDHVNGREESKSEMMSPGSNVSMEVDYDKKNDSSCMSPGALFDLKLREERSQSGIKTLLPVRPTTGNDCSRTDRSKSLDESHGDKGKGHRKRQLSEYSSDASTKSRRRNGMQELADDYGDLDDSAVDVEGPAALVYRFSRRKSDPKSDENSQSSQLNDCRVEKIITPKGDTSKRDSNNDPEDGEGVMMMINGELIKVEQLRREEIINCTCGFMEEDGLMIQCDLCLCWQHGHCNAIEREKDVPEKYICYICQHPYRQRASQKYIHDQDWIKEGKLQSLSKRTKDQTAINQRTAMLKRSFDLIGGLHQVDQVLHSLKVKINVAQKKDHPKLYLWAKNWEKSEIPKPILEPVPIMEIIKPEPVQQEDTVDGCAVVKSEVKSIIKQESDGKSIGSDTELMKILEEDNTISEESKVASKNADLNAKSDGHILMDALTKNENEDEKCTVNSAQIKTENVTSNSVTKESPVIKQEGINGETRMENNGKIEAAPVVMASQEPEAPLPFIPEPEAPIDPAECRLRLLEHVEHFQNHIIARLDTIEAQCAALEAMDDDCDVPFEGILPRDKQTVQMLIRDLNTVRKLAALC